MTSSALIVGSSGLVGSHLLQLLLESPHYEVVRSLVRRPSGQSHPKLSEHVVDFETIATRNDVVRGHDVFCCLGTTVKAAGSQEAFRTVDLTYVVESAATAQRNGASRCFVLSALGADPRSGFFYHRTKGEMEALLARMPFLSVGILRPSLLLGERKEVRTGERVGIVAMKTLAPLMIGSLRKLRPIRAADVAAGMLFLSRTNFEGVRIVESDEIQEMAVMAQGELRV